MVVVEGNTAEFVFFRPHAGAVHVTGDFNQWRTEELPMVRQPGGYWRARLLLPEGEYRFRYRADGEWFTDYGAFGLEPGPAGLDAVVRIARLPGAS